MVSGSRGLLGHQALKCHACAEGLSSLECLLARKALYQLRVYQLRGRLPVPRFFRHPGPCSLKGGGRAVGVSDWTDPMSEATQSSHSSTYSYFTRNSAPCNHVAEHWFHMRKILGTYGTQMQLSSASGLRIVSSCVGLRIVSFWLNMTVDRRGQNCQAPVSVSEPASASGSTLQSIKASEPSSSGSAVAAKYHQEECQKTHSMYSHSLLSQCCVLLLGRSSLKAGKASVHTESSDWSASLS